MPLSGGRTFPEETGGRAKVPGQDGAWDIQRIARPVWQSEMRSER